MSDTRIRHRSDRQSTTAYRRIVAASLVIGLVAVTLIGALPAGAAAQESGAGSLTIALHEDGSANLTTWLAYDLASDEEREAFATIRDDGAARRSLAATYEGRLATVASASANATGREMGVSDVTVDLRTVDDGSTGIVELSATWTGLAATVDGRLVVTEPFSSGFVADRSVTVRAPDGYALVSATPAPADRSGPRATWAAGTDLSGFRAVFARGEQPTAADAIEGPSNGATAPGQSGFGLAAALAGIAAIALLSARAGA